MTLLGHPLLCLILTSRPTQIPLYSLTEYFYRVRAYNADETSDWTSSVNVTTPAYDGPALTPTSFIATALTNTSVDLSWIDGGATDSYELQQSIDGGSTWETIYEPSVEVTFYNVTGKLPGSNYSFRLRAVNTVGNSSYTDELAVVFPERSFREFLQNEVLQDVVKYFGWYDRVKLPDQEFSVEQTFHAATNATAEELQHFKIDFIGGFLAPVYRLDSFTTIKVTPPLIAQLPTDTMLFGIWFHPPDFEYKLVLNDDWDTAKAAASTDDTYYEILVGQNPDHIDGEGNVVVDGAAIGDSIIHVMSQRIDPSTGDPIGSAVPYVMQGFLRQGGGWGLGNAFSEDITIETELDYTVAPYDAAPVYDAMTNEALLKIGFEEESEVPEEQYQRFRDAGKVAAWRFVSCSAVHLTSDTTTSDFGDLGSVDLTKSLSLIFTQALQQLADAEALYKARYETPASTPVVAVSKPRANSYASVAEVRF